MSFVLHINHFTDAFPWLLAKHLKQWIPPRFGYFFVCDARPLIVLIPENTYDDETDWVIFFHVLRNSNARSLLLIRGAVETDPAAGERTIREFLTKHLGAFPRHAFTLLANSAAQVAMFEQARLPYLFVNQNALADETAFRVLPDEEKQFDAIYSAVCAPFKRHYLARELHSLPLITDFPQARPNDYFPRARAPVAAGCVAQLLGSPTS